MKLFLLTPNGNFIYHLHHPATSYPVLPCSSKSDFLSCQYRDGESLDDMIHWADWDLYCCKHQGRGNGGECINV